MSITIKDIAKVVGVSTATVSRVLNRQGGYSKEVEEKVKEVAKNLNYRRNDNAASLVTQTTKIIGIIMPVVDSSFYSNIVTGIEDYAVSKGYSVILSHAGIEGEKFLDCFNVMIDRRVDGIIAFSLTLKEDDIRSIKNSNIPFLLISSISSDKSIPFLKIDDYSAAYFATQYLINKGHKKISIMGMNRNDIIAGEPRIQGYNDCLKDNGIEVDDSLIITGEFNFTSGQLGMRKIIDDKIDITAIFCVSDEVAAGAMSICYENNISIPDEISVIGFDNSNISWMIKPGITTIAQPFYEMGKNGCKKLITSLTMGEKIESEIVPFELIERESVKLL